MAFIAQWLERWFVEPDIRVRSPLDAPLWAVSREYCTGKFGHIIRAEEILFRGRSGDTTLGSPTVHQNIRVRSSIGWNAGLRNQKLAVQIRPDALGVSQSPCLMLIAVRGQLHQLNKRW